MALLAEAEQPVFEKLPARKTARKAAPAKTLLPEDLHYKVGVLRWGKGAVCVCVCWCGGPLCVSVLGLRTDLVRCSGVRWHQLGPLCKGSVGGMLMVGFCKVTAGSCSYLQIGL